MLISLNKNIALLAMTKTGTTSLEQAIAPHCDIVFTGNPQAKHMQLRRFERFIRPYLESIGQKDIETCCLFRDPIDWLGSWYRYRSREEITGHPNSTAELSFDEFVVAYMQEEPPSFASVGRQSEFVKSPKTNLGITHLFKYENFSDYVRFLEERFEMSLTLDQLNVSPKAQLELSAKNRSALENHLKDDFEIHKTQAK